MQLANPSLNEIEWNTNLTADQACWLIELLSSVCVVSINTRPLPLHAAFSSFVFIMKELNNAVMGASTSVCVCAAIVLATTHSSVFPK